MYKWLKIIIFNLFLLNCIPYIQMKRYECQVRVAVISAADSVIVSGIKDERYLKDYKIKTTDSLPILLNPFNGRVVVNGKPYRGRIEVKKINDKIWLINVLNIEDYLKGVVPCEIGKIDKKIMEAAKAQAVAARTYAHAHLGQYAEMGFDLYATVKDQVYEGMRVEDSVINQAIKMTCGIVLTYKGNPIDAKYHSTCGGYTADYCETWGGSPISYLKSKKCEFCKESPHAFWQREMTKQEFFSNLRANLRKLGNPIPDTEFIKSLKFKRSQKSKRILEVKIVTSQREYKIIGYNIRKLFGSVKDPDGVLKSSYINIYVKNDRIVIEGRGYGHGVGMCQYGAIGMAKKGKKFKEILNYYYQGTKLVRL
ncbi:MAG: SpoIID/LytB domain-containing protein [candidate division WOR-3 bacterium]|nr:SpoIID/LytB domain-containing protein [candidate division WOR-3 bacterium]